MKPIVYIVDDDSSVRHSLATLLEVAGYAVEIFSSGEEILERAPEGLGCILLDVRMTGIDGLYVQEALIQNGNPMPVIFLTAFGDVPRIVRAIKEGAEDFLIKPVDGELLLKRLEQVLENYAQRIDGECGRKQFVDRINGLTERELEVLALSIDGLTCKEIGVKLGVSYRTVELHRSHICTKAGTANLVELFRLVSKFGCNLV